jgi:hypothetical protein
MFDIPNSDFADELDISWIQENEKLENINSNFIREPLENIEMFFIYVNLDSCIENIQSEKQVLTIENNKSVLKKETILQLIQKRKSSTHKKYKFMDVLVYNVDLEPEHIQNYSKIDNILDNSKQFFKVLPIIDDIVIQSSIFIFHSLSSIYFIFKENNPVISIPKSILKDSTIPKHKNTKKVRIVLENLGSHSTTKKKRDESL